MRPATPNLGWKLAAALAGWAGPELLGSYDAERRPVFYSTAKDFIEKAIAKEVDENGNNNRAVRKLRADHPFNDDDRQAAFQRESPAQVERPQDNAATPYCGTWARGWPTHELCGH